jgi:hypothetical protein
MDLGTSSGGNMLVENMYIHDWTITALTTGSTTHGSGSICQNGATGPINATGNTITDQNTTAPVPFGACFRNLYNVEKNDCEYTAEGEVGHFGNTDGNVFANMDGNVIFANYDHNNHTNVLEDLGGSGPIYNNLIYNNNSAVTIAGCPIMNVYNNVMWNNGNSSIYVDPGCGQTVSSGDVANVYNNTVDCSNGVNCFRYIANGSHPATILNLQNNQWITSGTPTCYNGGGCGNISGGTQSDNLTMSTSTAASQGYTSANAYQPTTSTGGTVNAAVSLSPLCSGALGSLCADRLGNQRLTSWDAGAYEFSGAQSSSKPNPPTNLTASVQ